jgi:hypothetical protein
MAYDPSVFNVYPYYDDYDDDKKFLRVLYKPGYAVQARELTQAQTIAQKQVQRFGDHIFKDGSIVSESQVTNVQGQFVRVDNLSGYAGISINDFVGLTATVAAKNNSIRVTKALGGLSGSSKDTTSIFMFSEYLNGATGFAIGDTMTAVYNGISISARVTGGTATYNSYSGAPNVLPAFGDATLVGVDAGIRYVKGYFVNHDRQSILVYNITGSSDALAYRRFNNLTSTVRFDVANTIVNAQDDTTLNDPAFGSYNYAAPGADRYRLDLTLAQGPLSVTADYRLLSIDEDEITFRSNIPEYSVLVDTLARRTYDESGNYTLEDFPVFVDDITGDANEPYLRVKIGKGKAYVFGYEFINFIDKSITADKARNIKLLDVNQQIPIQVGNTVNVAANTEASGFTAFDKINWNSMNLFLLSDGATGAFSRVGTALVGKWDAIENSSQIHMYNVRLDSGYTPSSAKRLFYPGYTGSNKHVFSFTDGSLNINDADGNSLVFPFSNDISSHSIRNVKSQIFNIQRTKVIALPATISVSDFDDGTEFNSGTDVDFNSINDIKAFTITGAALSLTVTAIDDQNYSVSASSGVTAVVFANLEVTKLNYDPLYRAKTSTTETRTVVMTQNSYQKFAYLGGRVDAYEIVSITGNTGGSNFSMTNYFELDTGQRDFIYDWSRIVLKPQYYNSGVTGVSVTYRYYAHENSCAPYLLNSYASGGDPANLVSGTASGYKNLPLYPMENPRGNAIVSLGSCLDVRPDRITPSVSLTFGSSPETYGATGSSHLIGTNFEAQWSYYQPRSDKLVLTRDREFRLVKGVESDDRAPAPEDIQDAMTIATFTYDPFTKSAIDVQKFITKNRRYTMRDIGSLEKRIDRLEYYTTLSLEEKQAASLEIKDASGLNKFKNGIFVDNFSSRSSADTKNRDHKCSTDRQRRETRPRFITKYIDLGMTGALPAGLTFTTNGLLTFNYTTIPFIQQRFASKSVNVNPFDVTNFNGTLTLTPFSDDWIDTTTRPEVTLNINGQNDGLVDGQDVSLGVDWNDWETTWTGAPFQQQVVGVRVGKEHDPLTRGMQLVQTTIQGQVLQRQQRTGTQNFLRAETVNTSLGNRVVDLSIVPFMRSIDVNIKADGMRPNVRVYPFFDGRNVSSFVSNNGTTGAALITNVSGQLGYDTTVKFTIPAGTFRTGERLFRLIDDSGNVLSNATTTAEQTFRAQGLLKTEESTVVSTRNLTFRREAVNDERLFNNTITTVVETYQDPVAQTFLVDTLSYPRGMFIKKVEVFFKTKSANLPITLQIRPAINGYPSSSIVVPFSEVVKLPSAISTSTDSSVATEFSFDNPVYLQAGEYSIVLISNSNEYEVFVSEVGQVDLLTDNTITSQPYLGSFFKSQNASTWTPDQLLDLKFNIHRAVFSTTPATVQFYYDETNYDTEGYSSIDNGANLFRLNTTYITPPGTAVTSTVDFEGDGAGAISILPNENIVLQTKKDIKDTGTNTIDVYLTMQTNDAAVSPAIDLDRVSGIYVQNIINNFNDWTEQENYEKLPSVGGLTANNVAAMRYLTKQINLQNGFESEKMDVYLAARLPQGARIDVYMRSQLKTDTTKFNDVVFEKLVVEPTSAYGLTTNYLSVTEDDFVDLHYVRDITANRYTSGISGQYEFKNFQIKVVMYGDYTNYVVPCFRDFKAIAT